MVNKNQNNNGYYDDENGETQISYAITYPTIGSQTILDEADIVLVENPLI